MPSSFIKDWSKIRIVNWYWYETNGWEMSFRAGICHAIHRYGKAINEYMKNYDKNK